MSLFGTVPAAMASETFVGTGSTSPFDIERRKSEATSNLGSETFSGSKQTSISAW